MWRDVSLNKPYLFIAALSGRALAQAAHELQLTCTVADCFGDADTRRYAEQCHDIARRDAPLCIDTDKLMRALTHCASLHQRVVVVTGTGFEDNLAALKSLQQTAQALQLCCAFNDAEVMHHVTHPEYFFEALNAAKAPHPHTQSGPPSAAQQAQSRWLVKQRGGHGAGHIRRFSKGAKIAAEPIYYQEDITGCPYSICAISYISHIVCLHFNRQQVLKPASGPWQYRGAIAASAADLGLPPPVADELRRITSELCAQLQVRGLLSVDFMLSGDNKPYILELNARPTATFELSHCAAALAEHLKAFGVSGVPMPATTTTHRVAGHRYCFAPYALQVNKSLEHALDDSALMAHVSDWPMPDTRVAQAAPLCNLHAQGDSVAQVQALLAQREQLLLELVLQPAQRLVA